MKRNRRSELNEGSEIGKDSVMSVCTYLGELWGAALGRGVMQEGLSRRCLCLEFVSEVLRFRESSMIHNVY